MARGAISGFVWGTVLTGMALSVASLTAPLPHRGEEAGLPDGVAPSPAVDPAADPVAAPAAEPEASPEAPDAAAPEVGEAPEAPVMDPVSAPEAASDGVAPVMAEAPVTQAAPLDAPAEAAPATSVPATGGESGALPDVARAPDQPGVTPAEDQPEALAAAEAPAPGPAAPEAEAAPAAAAAPTGFPVADLDAVDTAPGLPGGGSDAAPATRLPQVEDAPEAPAETPAVIPDDAAEGTALAAVEAPRGLPGSGAVAPLTDRAGAAATEPATPLPAIKAYAAAYDATDRRPRMSIVLIDEGDQRVSLNSLRSFPYPVSFAIDASRPDAREVMEGYRAAGFEVLLRADLPEGATPADVETASQAWFAEVPEAVAVMEDAPGVLQRGRDSSEQLAEALAETGHGLLLYPEGLDTARKLAEREGVPAATLFRDFDAQEEDSKVIRRFLDYAALKAGQEEGGVVMVGRLRPETVSALLVWGLADRASRVNLVPVSAVLTEAQEAR